jgi:hypothetical protein
MVQYSIEEMYFHTLQKLKNVSRTLFSLRGAYYSLKLFFNILLLLILFAFSEFLFGLPNPGRYGFWMFSLVLLTISAVKYILPYFKKCVSPSLADYYYLSKQISREYKFIGDSLVDFLQIYNNQSTSSTSAFKILSLKQLYEKFKDSDFKNIVSIQLLRTPLKKIAILMISFLLLLFFFPQSLGQAVLTVVYPTKSFEENLPIVLNNVSGDLTILKNEDVLLKGQYEGERPDKLWLITREISEAKDSVLLQKHDIPKTLNPYFSSEFKKVKEGFDYWFEAELSASMFKNKKAVSNKKHVYVTERPFIRNLQIQLQYPDYSKLPPQKLSPNDGEINALVGTQVMLELEANKMLDKATLILQDSSTVDLRITGNRASGSFNVKGDDQYYVKLYDSDSISNYQPIKYSIFSVEDEKPYVQISKPGQDLDLGEELNAPLSINLRDDFGFSRLFLKGKIIRGLGAADTNLFQIKLPFQVIEKGKATSETVWDLYSFYLVPDDFIEYYAEVYDNDRINGPKFARSKSYVLRLPSFEEILNESHQKLAEEIERTEDVAKESKELLETLKEINRELKRERDLTWEQKKQLQEQLKQQESSVKKMEEIQKNLEEIVNELEEKKVLNPGTLEKYFELQKMFQEMATPEMLEAMKKLNEALEKMDLEQIKKSLDEFQFSVEEFEKKIERSYELFKRVELEQRMDELRRMAEKITEEQKLVNENLEEEKTKSDQSKTENTDLSSKYRQLANKEESLKKQTEFLEKQIDETGKLYQEMESKKSEELESSKEFIIEQRIPSNMTEMMNQISSGKMSAAKNQGENIVKQMEMLQSMLQNAQQKMLEMQKQDVMNAMKKVSQDMLDTSFQQENLANQSNRTDMASPQLNNIARKQSQVRENVSNAIEQMVDISKRTFFMSPQMSETMSSMVQNIDSAIENLENRNPQRASQYQKRTMANLNQAVMMMQNSMNQLSQASSASGMEEFLQQLQQMAGQQGQLNQESMGLFQQQGQGKMQLSQDALRRLATQQEMIQNSLEELNNQMGNRREVLGRLGDLGEEMGEVIKKLQQEQLDRKVIERQERILSRLLDAQKSMREKDHSKKRLAERDRQFTVKSPGELKKDILNKEDELQKELLKSLQEGYSNEYKDFIRLYYEILSRYSNEN